jgi:uncharacterized caspase-like protein
MTHIFCCHFRIRAQFPQSPGPGPSKLALVVGCNAYGFGLGLSAAVSSARAVAERLKSLGFAVIYANDPSLADLEAAMDVFIGRLLPGCTAVVYFCGHGWQSDEDCLLVPVDFTGNSPHGW